MDFKWHELKSQRLKVIRDVAFEEIVHHRIVAVEDHPRDEHQKILLFERNGCIWAAPCVIDQQVVFLKTLYPSRKFTKKYLRGDYEKV